MVNKGSSFADFVRFGPHTYACTQQSPYPLLFTEMINWHWHSVVSSPSNQELLVSINWSFYLIYFCYKFFDRAKETNIYENKIQDITFADINLPYFSSFIFKKNYCFIEEENLQKKLLQLRKNSVVLRWHWKLRGFTSNFVHQWGAWESHSS